MVQSEATTTTKELLKDRLNSKLKNKQKINFDYSPELLKKSTGRSHKHQLTNSSTTTALLAEQTADSGLHQSVQQNTHNTDRNEITKQVCCFQFNFRIKHPKHLDPSTFQDQSEVTFQIILFKLIQRSLWNFSKAIFFSCIYCAAFLGMIFCLSLGREHLTQSNESNITENPFNSTSSETSFKCEYCYFTVWTTTSFLVLIYPAYILLYLLNCHWCMSGQNQLVNGTRKAKSLKNLIVTSFRSFYILSNHSQEMNPSRQRLKSDFFFEIFFIVLIWIVTGYSFLSALNLISLVDVVILYSLNLSAGYMTSWIVLHNKFIPVKLMGFILSIAAVIFTLYSGSMIFNTRLLGNVCAITSASGSAILQVIWKNATKNMSNNQRTMLTTLIGLCSILFGWPLLVVLHLTGVESLNFFLIPLEIIAVNKEAVLYSVLGGTFGLIYTFLTQFGHLWINEKYLYIGSLMGVSISFGSEIWLSNAVVSGMRVQAFICSFFSYILMLLPDDMYMKLRKYFCPEPLVTETTKGNSLTRRYAKAYSPDIVRGNSSISRVKT